MGTSKANTRCTGIVVVMALHEFHFNPVQGSAVERPTINIRIRR